MNGSKNEIDIQELINVVMDLSLDIFGALDQNNTDVNLKLNDSSNIVPTRYS